MPATGIIIDCDAGLDDAIAIALAAAAPALEIEAVTTVAGNAPVACTTANALATLAAIGLDVPVWQGLTGAIDPDARYGMALWGGDGGIGLPPATRPAEGAALAFLEQRLDRAPSRSVTLCPIGPLTNIAALFDRRPDLADRIARMVVMGGALDGGNATVHAEFNIWFDPPSAARAFQADLPAVIVPLDVTNKIVIDWQRIDDLATASSPAARLAAKLLPLAGTNSHATAIHDASVIGFLLWPDLFERRTGYVSIVCNDGPEFGRMLFAADPAGRHVVLTDVDRDALIDRMIATFVAAPGSEP
jgi:inosine-uridine nucleoside N-ribohydrolase